MSAIFLDGSIVHYEALGRGRPIVFLHGWVGSWRYWINSMQIASTSFRAYAIDLFGFGESTRDPLRYSLDRQADLINRFMEEMGIGKVALIGHGLGALVGFAFIRQQPKSVDRIMAINCPLEFGSVDPRMWNGSMVNRVEWLTGRGPEGNSPLMDALKADPNAISASKAGFQVNNLFSHIQNLSIPCLLVYGPNDPAIDQPKHEYAESLPIHIHQITLEGTGHFPMIENPVQFNRLMTDFLALDSGMSPRELQLKDEWRRRVR